MTMRTNSRPAGEQEEIARVRHYIREITGDHYAGTEAGAVLDLVDAFGARCLSQCPPGYRRSAPRAVR